MSLLPAIDSPSPQRPRRRGGRVMVPERRPQRSAQGAAEPRPDEVRRLMRQMGKSTDAHDHGHHHDDNQNNNTDDEDEGGDAFVEIPGLAALPSLIATALARAQNKNNGKRPHEILSATQLREASRHNAAARAAKHQQAADDKARHDRLFKPPRLITTDGVRFFSSMRVLNFYENTKNNLTRQKAVVLNQPDRFTERDLNTFHQMWKEEAILHGDIEAMRDEMISKSRKMECNCHVGRFRQHAHAKWCNKRLRKKLDKEERNIEDRHARAQAKRKVDEEAHRRAAEEAAQTGGRGPTPLKPLPPLGLLSLPQAEDMAELRWRATAPPPLTAWHTRDVFIEDMKVVRYVVRVIQEAVDAVNKIADRREAQDAAEAEARRIKREEMQALADAAERAANISDSDSDSSSASDDDDGDGDGRAGGLTGRFRFKGETVNTLARRLLPIREKRRRRRSFVSTLRIRLMQRLLPVRLRRPSHKREESAGTPSAEAPASPEGKVETEAKESKDSQELADPTDPAELEEAEEAEEAEEEEDKEQERDSDSDSSSDDSLYPSECSDDYEDAFGDDAALLVKSRAITGPGEDTTEREYRSQLMESAIVRVEHSLVPPTWLKWCTEVVQMVRKDRRGRGIFTDFTGCEGQLCVLGQLFVTGWESMTCYESGYRDLTVAMMMRRCMVRIVQGYEDSEASSDGGALGSGSSDDSSSSESSDDEGDGYAPGGGFGTIDLSSMRKREKEAAHATEVALADAAAGARITTVADLPAAYSERRLVARLGDIVCRRRDWEWEEDHRTWPTGQAWEKSDVLLVDEQKLWKGNGALLELDRVMRSQAWQDRELDDASVMELCRAFIGEEMMRDQWGSGWKTVTELEGLLEEMHRVGGDRVDESVRKFDPETAEYLDLKVNLKRRRMIRRGLGRLREGALVLAIRPWEPADGTKGSSREMLAPWFVPPEEEQGDDGSGDSDASSRPSSTETNAQSVPEEASSSDEETEEEALLRYAKAEWLEKQETQLEEIKEMDAEERWLQGLRAAEEAARPVQTPLMNWLHSPSTPQPATAAAVLAAAEDGGGVGGGVGARDPPPTTAGDLWESLGVAQGGAATDGGSINEIGDQDEECLEEEEDEGNSDEEPDDEGITAWERPDQRELQALRREWLEELLLLPTDPRFDRIEDNFVFAGGNGRLQLWQHGPCVEATLFRRVVVVEEEGEADDDHDGHTGVVVMHSGGGGGEAPWEIQDEAIASPWLRKQRPRTDAAAAAAPAAPVRTAVADVS